jgi:hypothetical protein
VTTGSLEAVYIADWVLVYDLTRAAPKHIAAT